MAEGLDRSPPCPTRWARWATSSAARPASRVGKMRVPLGVIGIIYESPPERDRRGRRPVPQVAATPAILRGGTEALHSNQAIAACVRAGAGRRPACPSTRDAGAWRPPTARPWAS